MKNHIYLCTINMLLFLATSCSNDDTNPTVNNETPPENGVIGSTGNTGSTDDDDEDDTPKEDDKTTTFNIDKTRETLIIQTETATLNSDWKLRTTIEGYNGTGYIVWEGADLFWKDKLQTSSALKYTINIESPGLYEFKWRSVVGKGTNSTEHNDTWLKFPDADDFFTYVNRDFVFNNERKEIKIANIPGKFYPRGSDKTPVGISGENKEGFMKIFMNNTSWQEIASTWDHNGFRIFTEFKTKGDYTIEIVPRSSFHAIDELKLIPVK